MIIEGLKLMVIGMAIVYLFLIILMLLIMFSAKVFKSGALATTPCQIPPKTSDNVLIAVVSAAISAYKVKRKRKN